ncbi:MAG: arginase family protein [Gemmataceae bacterium]
MDSHIHLFPFDLFGGGGTAVGVQLLADAVREMIEDNEEETKPTRALAYQGRVELHEETFETMEAYQAWRTTARRAIQEVWSDGDFLFWVTGNHLGALPIYDELATAYPDTLVVQFDAHLDVYDLSDCTSELSHGNFLLHSESKLPPIVNLGHRELLLPQAHTSRYFTNAFPADQLCIDPKPAIETLKQLAQSASRIVIDLDCDVFDAAFFPAIAHPQPFGMSPSDLLRLLDAVWSDKVVGLAISEFHTAHDVNDRSLALLVWLLEYTLLRIYEKERG